MSNEHTTNQPEDCASMFMRQFQLLTDNPPMSWQERLFRDHFIKNELPPVVDLPTGLGKTMVMAIWLIARSINCKLPRRLIYVVDRRTVVDQATDLAMKLRDRFGKNKLAISTLRGQLADNREWSQDPSKLAIIIGTVDLIGSGLLFSGYRSSYKRRPLEGGLLGQDSLLVLDEAHLSKPFEQLLVGRKREGGTRENGIEQFQSGQGTPMKVVRMSATTEGEDGNRFKLEQTDLNDGIIEKRFKAPKRLTIEPPAEKSKLNDTLKSAAIALARSDSLKGKRIVVFVRSPDDATKIAESIRKYESTRNKPGPFADSVEVLTGTMRGLERDELLKKKHVLKRFLDGDEVPAQGTPPVFLISTSAGEVGFDLNGDHMVSDQTTIDSFIQRLGRVNRRGTGDATIILIPEVIKRTDKDGKPRKLDPLEQAVVNALDLLTGQSDLSPKTIDMLKKNAWKDGYVKACSPPPTMVDLTDILLDAWSMTSITEPMPGRPEVAPWIRGIADDLPQTTMAWRAELDLPGFDQLDLETIEEWFDTHRVLTHETLSVPTSVAAKWFADRWDHLDDTQKSEVSSRSIIVDRAGLKRVTVKEVINQVGRKNTDSIRNADLILPASFGGIDRGKGLLDAEAPEIPKDESKQSAEDRAKALALGQAAPDVADEHGRYRELITKPEDGEPDIRPIGSGAKPPNPSQLVVELESDDVKRVQLISYVLKQEKPEWGSKKQMLIEHVELVRKRLDEILERFELPGAVKHAAELAADFHDHGKNRERWQRTVNGVATPAGQKWSDQTLGKSGGDMKRDPRGYRHEFGSLREFTDAQHGKVDQDVFDLAMHLIAVHHGRGRPLFPKGGFDPDAESRSTDIHTDSIRRFARLQRKYGHWRLAWLENLLRCADALASADQEAEDDVTDESMGSDGGVK